MLAYFAEEHSCLTAVGFQRRHIPAQTALKQTGRGAGGRSSKRTVSFLKSTDLSQHAGHYGGVIDNLTVDGCHAVDNLRFLCGGEVEHVAAPRPHALRAPGPSPNEFTALVSFSSGAVGVLQSSYVDRPTHLPWPSFTGRTSPPTWSADRESYTRGG